MKKLVYTATNIPVPTTFAKSPKFRSPSRESMQKRVLQGIADYRLGKVQNYKRELSKRDKLPIISCEIASSEARVHKPKVWNPSDIRFFQCTCEDWRYRRAPCRHIIALLTYESAKLADSVGTIRNNILPCFIKEYCDKICDSIREEKFGLVDPLLYYNDIVKELVRAANREVVSEEYETPEERFEDLCCMTFRYLNFDAEPYGFTRRGTALPDILVGSDFELFYMIIDCKSRSGEYSPSGDIERFRHHIDTIRRRIALRDPRFVDYLKYFMVIAPRFSADCFELLKKYVEDTEKIKVSCLRADALLELVTSFKASPILLHRHIKNMLENDNVRKNITAEHIQKEKENAEKDLQKIVSLLSETFVESTNIEDITYSFAPLKKVNLLKVLTKMTETLQKYGLIDLEKRKTRFLEEEIYHIAYSYGDLLSEILKGVLKKMCEQFRESGKIKSPFHEIIHGL